jgi:hydroxymethylglutaryl-CoA synthase
VASGGHLAEILDGALALPARRVPARRGRRAAADPDEDALTLAATAALDLLARREGPPPGALLLATTSAPYDAGGNVQVVAEIAGLAGDLFAAELTATPRDGLAALRLGAALAAAGPGPVLVVAANVRGPGAPEDEGDGAAALLVGDGGGVARLAPGRARTHELRDRWRLAGERETREGDPSFCFAPSADLLARVADGADGQLAVAGPSARLDARLEGGPGDPVAARAGRLGAAHALARLLVALDRPVTVAAAASGHAEACASAPLPGAAAVAERARATVAAGRDADAPLPAPDGSGLDPYQSGPRAWRERGQELRLEGRRDPRGRPRFPPGPGDGEAVPLGRAGTVLTHTRDRAYPGAAETGMAVVDVDGGGRFYGQVVPSGQVAVGQRVRLVPRRLHEGGGMMQYFWKVAPEEDA